MYYMKDKLKEAAELYDRMVAEETNDANEDD